MSDIRICIQNLGKYNEGELWFKWLDLPIDDDELEEALEEIGIDDVEYEEIMIADYECEFMSIGEWDSISRLNEIAEQLDDLDDWDRNKLRALLEYGESFDNAIDILDDCSLMEDVHSERELGLYILQEGLLEDIPDNLLMYIDEEAVGRDWSINGSGGFTKYGYLEIY